MPASEIDPPSRIPRSRLKNPRQRERKSEARPDAARHRMGPGPQGKREHLKPDDDAHPGDGERSALQTVTGPSSRPRNSTARTGPRRKASGAGPGKGRASAGKRGA